MALPKTNRPIKPKKLKKFLFARAWCRGASARWKIDFYDKLYFKKHASVYDY